MNKSIIDFLQNKKGVILYDKLRGVSVVFRCINYNMDTIICVLNGQNLTYSKYGGYSNLYPNGEQILVPSKEIQDWHKFAWKKGDILYNELNNEYCIFDKFTDNNYLLFKSKYLVDGLTDKVITITYDSNKSTSYYKKVSNEKAKEVTAILEEHYGGKLNLSTLEIEKPQFKDGDILVVDRNQTPKGIFIFDEKNQPADLSIQISISAYALYDAENNILTINDGVYVGGRKLRLATDSEKQQLFDALEKEGKRWNPDTKTLEDLPKKCEFKPTEWCLMRCIGDVWKLCQFGFIDDEEEDSIAYNAVGGSWFDECIPYNDKTAHLLGTNDDWKGGEG